MASLTDYFAGLSVTATEIQQAELLAEQVLQSKYPSLDLREGTGVRDLVIRPFATLLAMTNKSLNLYFEQNTLDKVDDETSTAMVDSIMSNWFIYRNLGTKAVINARLYFARSKNITLTADTYFSTDNTLKFIVGTSTTISSSNLTLDVYNNEYYYDIDLTAESPGTDYNLSSGSLLYFSNFDPFFLRAEITYLASEAGNAETNTEFISRAETAISTRNLINNPSIVSNLEANYTSIKDILPVGYGDSEMIRDRILVTVPSSVDPVMIHSGGKVDVYCRAGLEYVLLQLTTDALGRAMIPGPAIDATRSQITGGDEEDTLPFHVEWPLQSGQLISSGMIASGQTTTQHGLITGDLITIIGAEEAEYNVVDVPVTVTGLNTFTYPFAGSVTSPATGTISVRKDVPFELKRTDNLQYTLLPEAMTYQGSGTRIDVGLANHPFVVDRYVTVAGADQSEYNGIYLITEASKDSFSYNAGSAPGNFVATTSTDITVTQMPSDKDYAFSDRNTASSSVLHAEFDLGYANMTVSFNVLQHKLIDDVQSYFDDPESKVVCGDYLARGFNVYMLTIEVMGYNGPSPDATLCQTLINSYIDGLRPGAPFLMGELVSVLNKGGITNIRTPIEINYKLYTRDLIYPPFAGVITDFLEPNDRTAIFYLDSVTTNNTSI